MKRAMLLIYVVEYAFKAWWKVLRSLPAIYRKLCIPMNCQLCGDRHPTHDYRHPSLYRLPRRAAHPGRGKWVCPLCLYPADIPIGHRSTVEEALAFRDQWRVVHDTGGGQHVHCNDSLKVIYAKRETMNGASSTAGKR